MDFHGDRVIEEQFRETCPECGTKLKTVKFFDLNEELLSKYCPTCKKYLNYTFLDNFKEEKL